MRGNFNDTLTAKYGERSRVGTPGLAWLFDAPCRKVLQREVSQRQFPFTLTRYWVTLDAAALNGVYVSSPWLGAVFSDYEAADRVAFASDPLRWYYVCREEKVFPFGRSAYLRYLLIPVESIVRPPWPPPVPSPPSPTPPPPVVPGPTCGSAGVVGLNQAAVTEGTNIYEAWWRLEVGAYTENHVYVVGGAADMFLQVYQGSCPNLYSINSRTGPGSLQFDVASSGVAFLRMYFPTVRPDYGLLVRPGH
jgi:hypothetical protein